MAGELIVTGEMASTEAAWLDELRRRYYPPERNQLKAHLTMFHALPPSAEAEVRGALGKLVSKTPPPRASVEGLMNLGSGVAFRIVSTALDGIRRELAEMFHGLLSAQDSGGWRPHVTIQNKVSANEAKQLLARLEGDFRPCPLRIHGLGLHRYLGGPWEALATYPFRGN